MAQNLKDTNFSQIFSSRKVYLHTEKATLMVAFLIVMVVTILSWYVVKRIELQTREQISVTLKESLFTVQEAFEIWAYERITDALVWGLNKTLQFTVADLFEISHDDKTLLAAPESQEIDDYLDRSINDYRYIGYTIVSSDNIVLASNFKRNVGKSPAFLKELGFLTQVLAGKSFLSMPMQREDFTSPDSVGFTTENMLIFSAVPIQNSRDKIIAALIFHIDPSRDFSRITLSQRLGITGEILAIDRKGDLLTESRLKQQFIEEPFTNHFLDYILLNISKSSIIEKTDTDLDGHIDYRGVSVVSSWAWNDSLGFGLIAKIDRDEAYKSFRLTRKFTLVMIGTTIILFFGLLIFHIRSSRNRIALLENIRDKETRMASVVDNIFDGVITASSQGIVDSFSSSAEEIFGFKANEIIGKNLTLLIPDLDKSKTKILIDDYIETGKRKVARCSSEHTGQKRDGSNFPLNLSISIMVLDSDPHFICIVSDITEQKMAEQSLRESEQRLTMALGAIRGGIWDWNLATNEFIYSPQWLESFGYTHSDLSPDFDSWAKLMYPDDLAHAMDVLNTHIEGKSSLFRFDYRSLDKSGKWQWHDVQGMVVVRDMDGKPLRLVGIDMDISDRKLIEVELNDSREKLRHFATYLQSSQEMERERLCREIHDELGQSLTVLKLNLSWMLKKIPVELVEISNTAMSMIKLTDDTIDAVRRIATGLRPRVLDDLGLKAAIQWHSNEIKSQTGIKCIFNCDLNHSNLDRELSITIFRIYQEAMTNVIRHAKASSVVITLKEIGEEISLVIRDNGIGINEDQIIRSSSFGILGIKERVVLWGGKLEIQGIPGKGTSVFVLIPIQKKKSEISGIEKELNEL